MASKTFYPCGCVECAGVFYPCERVDHQDYMAMEDVRVSEFTIKDSGERQSFSGGMVRDISTDKIDYLLTRDGPMYLRWAIHLTNGAKKYAKRNWMLASGPEEQYRFKESALRHFEQWLAGDRTEDHAAAMMFNINGYEYCLERESKK